MASDTVVRARIDGQVKEKAAKVLADMGLSVSDAIRLLLVRIAVEKALPFEIKVPNEETRAAMAELEQGAGASFDSVADLMADLNAGRLSARRSGSSATELHRDSRRGPARHQRGDAAASRRAVVPAARNSPDLPGYGPDVQANRAEARKLMENHGFGARQAAPGQGGDAQHRSIP